MIFQRSMKLSLITKFPGLLGPIGARKELAIVHLCFTSTEKISMALLAVPLKPLNKRVRHGKTPVSTHWQRLQDCKRSKRTAAVEPQNLSVLQFTFKIPLLPPGKVVTSKRDIPSVSGAWFRQELQEVPMVTGMQEAICYLRSPVISPNLHSMTESRRPNIAVNLNGQRFT